MKIVDIKTKIIPSNPRSKNYPIGYPGGIASNSNGVTPDLSIYLLKEIWERNFEERTDEYGNEYLYIRKPLAIGGGATMYASNGVVVPSIFDGLPLDNTTIRKNPETGLIEVIGGTGTSFDENAMWSALSGSSDNQINKSHLTTALDGYATQNWVIENYATKSELSAVSNKLNDFLEGSDTDTIINKWKELEAFLSGMTETDNLAEILETKADKKYVDSTFVTLATKQTITGEKTFSSVMNTAAIKASGAITAPSLAASDWVTIAGIKLRKLEDGALMLEGNLALTGALTMYASNGQSFDTIYDGLPIDNDTIYWGTVDGKKVLKAKGGGEAGSVSWDNISGRPSVYATNIANITDLHSSWDAVLKSQKPNWLTAVSIATISDLHANWDALLKAAPSAYVTRWPTISEVTGKQNLIVKLNGGTTEGTNQFTYNATGAKTINITPAGIGAATSGHTHTVIKNNLMLKGPNGISDSAGITLALGDSDTGFKWISDGAVQIYANNTAIGQWNSSGINWLKAPKVNGKKIWYEDNDGHGSGLDADTLDGTEKSGLFTAFSYSQSTLSATIGGVSKSVKVVGAFPNISGVSMNTIASYGNSMGMANLTGTSTNVNPNGQTSWHHFINISYNTESDNMWQSQIAIKAGTTEVWVRSRSGGTISDSSAWAAPWVRLARITDNVYSATKLQTARSLWGNNFDGTGPITGKIIASNGIYLPYTQKITNQFGDILKTDYDNSTGYNDYFKITAIGENKVEKNLIGGNTGLLTWSGNRFVFNSYGNGWYVEDNEWMRTYGSLFIPLKIQCNGNIACGSMVDCSTMQAYELNIKYGTNFKFVRMSWNGTSGDVVSFFVPGSTSQWFTMELRSNGVLYTNGNILATGGATFYGSDIRYKSIMQQVNLSLLDIAKAPSFVYHWNKEGMKCDRLNLGGSAQYTQSVLPWAVEDNDNFLSMDYATVAYTFAVHTARHLLTYETRTDKKIKKLEREIVILKKQLKKLGYEEVRTLDDQSV